jgi:hypothetical protein
MRSSRALWGAALSFAALSAHVVGCMLVSPLEEFATAAAGTSSLGAAGKPPNGGSSGQGGDGPQSGAAGHAGAQSNGECRTNLDCMAGAAGEPYVCRASDRRCVRVKTEECPISYGMSSDPNAILFGAFASLNPANPEANSVVWAHRLALEELSGDNVGGLPDGPDGKRRPLVLVVCNNDEALVEGGLKHLVRDLEVPAVLATLQPGDLRRGFETHRASQTFYLSPVVATRTVVQLKDDGLVWNLLGQPSDSAPTYAELLRLTERRLRGVLPLPSEEKLRVALVTTTDAYDEELARYVTPALTFNGESSSVNEAAGYFAGFTIESDGPPLEQTVREIIEFRPHVLISAANEVFTRGAGVMHLVEASWQDTDIAGWQQQRPFYLLSPYNAGSARDVATLLKELNGGLGGDNHKRVIGASIAGAKDRTLQNRYATRLRTRFKEAYVDSGNYYDAFYLLAYAAYASGEWPLTGPGIARGMLRVTQGEPVDIGPAHIADVFDTLIEPSAQIQLTGTLGPTNFDAKGTQATVGSVFCFGVDGASVGVFQDVLRYDVQAEELQGEFPCFNGFFP